jgi:hypothetical protein
MVARATRCTDLEPFALYHAASVRQIVRRCHRLEPIPRKRRRRRDPGRHAGDDAEPSCLISCSQTAPAGGRGALMGRHGWMKPVGKVRGRVNISGKIAQLGRIASPSVSRAAK